MLKLLVIAILSLQSCFCFLFAEDKEALEKQKVIDRLQEFTEIINKGNVNDLDTFWTEDAEIINPVNGETAKGKQEITKYLQNQIQELKNKKIKFTVGDIMFSDANSATVQGVLQFFDNGTLVDRAARKIDLIKVDGKWNLDFIREIEVALPPSNSYSHLKDLEWLLGKWVDEDDNVDISFNTQWDKNKNFIVQSFSMDVLGLDALEGRQIIGWDSVEGKIRSWVYDSDGGFGSGTWSKKDGGWQATMDYTLDNGKKASATNIYTPIDEKSYSYSSIDRKVDNNALPNVESVTLSKEE